MFVIASKQPDDSNLISIWTCCTSLHVKSNSPLPPLCTNQVRWACFLSDLSVEALPPVFADDIHFHARRVVGLAVAFTWKGICSLYFGRRNIWALLYQLIKELKRSKTLGTSRWLSFFRDLFIYLEGREKVGETEIFHLLVHPPNGCNSWSRTGLKTVARDLLRVFPVACAIHCFHR